jgi:hypothetical protein
MKSYQEIEKQIFLLKLEGNYCMVRQLFKIAKHKCYKCKQRFVKHFLHQEIAYNVYRNTENTTN